jgi:SAM-dependent methyltransferase
MGIATGDSASAAYDSVGRYKQDEVNGFAPGLVDRMLDSAKVSGTERVLDAMGGDGNLTLRLHAYCVARGLPFPRCTVLEFSRVQSEFARHAVAPLGSSVVWGTVLGMKDLATGEPLPDASFDRVLIKSGTHEIPRDLQPELYRSVFRILRPGGLFTNLGFVFDDVSERDEVRELARVKDRLAGMQGAVLSRYFLLRGEFYSFLREAGFTSVHPEEAFQYHIRSHVVAEQYYGSDRRIEADLENQAAQVRALTLRRHGRIEFEGTSTILHFPGEITTARKPRTLELPRVDRDQHPTDLLRHATAHREILEEVARFAADGESVLDLGCGTGLLTEVLPHERLSYRGLDASAELVRIARGRYGARSGVTFEAADVSDTELGAGTIDVATILNLLHLPGIDAAALLRKAWGALKPGGRLVVSGPLSPDSFIQMEPFLFDQLRRNGALAGNEDKLSALFAENRRLLGRPGYYCSAEGMEALLKHLGFSRTLAARTDLAHGFAYFVVAQK